MPCKEETRALFYSLRCYKLELTINLEIKKTNFQIRTESWPFHKKRDDETREMVFLCKSFVYNKTQRCEARAGVVRFIIMSRSNERCVKPGLLLK